MNIQAQCHSCGYSQGLSEFYLGKKVRCPRCGAIISLAQNELIYDIVEVPDVSGLHDLRPTENPTPSFQQPEAAIAPTTPPPLPEEASSSNPDYDQTFEKGSARPHDGYQSHTAFFQPHNQPGGSKQFQDIFHKPGSRKRKSVTLCTSKKVSFLNSLGLVGLSVFALVVSERLCFGHILGFMTLALSLLHIFHFRSWKHTLPFGIIGVLISVLAIAGPSGLASKIKLPSMKCSSFTSSHDRDIYKHTSENMEKVADKIIAYRNEHGRLPTAFKARLNSTCNAHGCFTESSQQSFLYEKNSQGFSLTYPGKNKELQKKVGTFVYKVRWLDNGIIEKKLEHSHHSGHKSKIKKQFTPEPFSFERTKTKEEQSF